MIVIIIFTILFIWMFVSLMGQSPDGPSPFDD